jgi:RND family efflux transporter MFP subunit
VRPHSVHFAGVVTLLAVVVALVTSCNKKEAPAAGGRRGMKQPAFAVEVLRVDAKPRELSVAAPGVVDAFERVQITARVSGVLDKVSFVEGQEVKRGQPLALIDSRRYALSVSSARAALAKAQATVGDVQQSLKRRETASENNPGLVPGEEIETFRTRLRTAQADADQAAEALKLAQLNLEDSQVKAATEGVIQTRNVQTGQYLQAGAVIATLLQREPMLLRFNVTTAEAPRLKIGMPVDFTLKESQQAYTAKITLVGGSADPESRLVPVTAEIDSTRKFWLRPGSFATVSVKLTSQRQFPMIPQSAARPSDRGFVAFIIEGDTAHEKLLELGMHTVDGWVEVRDGLAVGDQIVTRGVEALAEGTKVTVAPATPPGSAPSLVASPNASGGAPAASGSRSGEGRSADGEGRKRRGANAAASAGPAAGEAP